MGKKASAYASVNRQCGEPVWRDIAIRAYDLPSGVGMDCNDPVKPIGKVLPASTSLSCSTTAGLRAFGKIKPGPCPASIICQGSLPRESCYTISLIVGKA